MNKKQVQQQFENKASAYTTSVVHAQGASLARLVETVSPRPEWVVLDVATAAGHTAHTLAPHVHAVVATDLTHAMAAQAGALAREKGLANVRAAQADAERLPFPAAYFDLVTCRIAAHHFPDIDRFLAEAVRVLRPGGLLCLVDNIVPGSKLRGKKGRVQRQAGRYVNAFERLRDPSHRRCLSIHGWRDAFYAAGFTIHHEEILAKEMDFHSWAARMDVSPADTVRLHAMLRQAPREVLEFLTPVFQGDKITFTLSEALIVGKIRD